MIDPAAPARLPDAAPAPDWATLHEALCHFLVTDDHATAYVVRRNKQTRHVSRAAVRALVYRYAAGLLERGVASGDRVVVALPTSEDFVGAFWAAVLLGAIPVPVAPVSGDDNESAEYHRLVHVIAQCEPSAVVASEATRSLALNHQVVQPADDDVTTIDLRGSAPTPGDIAILQYTSGSTSSPQGCALTHAGVTHNLTAIARRLEIDHPMFGANWCPLHHDMGLIGGVVLPVWSHCAVMALQPTNEFVFNPLSWLHLLSDYQGEISSSPNAGFALVARRLARRPLPEIDLRSVRHIVNGAEPIHPPTVDRFVELLQPVGLRADAIHAAFGLAENVLMATSAPGGLRCDRVERASVKAGEAVAVSDGKDVLEVPVLGRPVIGVELRIVDANGVVVGDRTIGEVEIRSASAMKEYFRASAATAAAFHDGWLRTGDLGYVVEGDLHLVGRTRDLIIVGGRNFHAFDVEQVASKALNLSPGSVAAFATQRSGSEAAVIVIESRERDHASAMAVVRRSCKEIIGLVPSEVLLVRPGRLPRTTSGKLRRQAARDAYEAGVLTASTPAAASASVGPSDSS